MENEESVSDARDKPRGLESRSVIQVYGFALMMFVCLFMPVAKGCSGSLKYPIEQVTEISPVDGLGDLIGRLTIFTAYANGLFTAILVTISACLVSRVFWWRSFQVQFAITLGVAILFLIVELCREVSDRKHIELLLYFAVPTLIVTAWIWSAWRRGKQEIAWLRYQLSWILGGVFVVHLQCLFGQVHVGYFIALAALLGQAYAFEQASRRMQHDLWDATQPIPPPQFSIRQIFVWMTFLPVAFAYFRTMDSVLTWFFS